MRVEVKPEWAEPLSWPELLHWPGLCLLGALTMCLQGLRKGPVEGQAEWALPLAEWARQQEQVGIQMFGLGEQSACLGTILLRSPKWLPADGWQVYNHEAPLMGPH